MMGRLALKCCRPLPAALFWLCSSTVCFADAIYTCDGASAQVSVLDQFSQQVGASPAFINSTATINYTQYPSTPGTVTVSETGYAAATPGAANLLQISSTFSSPNALQTVGASQPDPDPYVAASWNNVAATVSGPAGSPLPSEIRLEFQITYTPPSQLSQVSSLETGFTAQTLYVNGGSMALTDAGVPLQAGMPAVTARPDGSLTGSFYLDLPLSSSGTSNQFNLGLVYNPIELLNHMANLSEAMTLSLTGILLPNGMPLSSEGDNVTFDSGLPPPLVPTPEPTTWMLWCAVAALGAVNRLRSRRARS
jgi:hypothetical protein